MCPKCKSRERYRLIDRLPQYPPSWYFYRSFKIIQHNGLVIKTRFEEVFFCSNCGYELGRWG